MFNQLTPDTRQRDGSWPHPWDVGHHLKGDPTARYGAAGGHPFEQVVCKTLAPGVDVDTDPLPQDQLHVGGVAELDHHSNCQVHAVLRPGSPTTELGTLVDGGVPRCLCLDLGVREQITAT